MFDQNLAIVGLEHAEKCLCVLFSRLLTVSVGFTQISLVISPLLLLLINKYNSMVTLEPLCLLLCHRGNLRPYSGSWVSSLSHSLWSAMLNLVSTKDAQTTGAEQELVDIACPFLGITLGAGS